MVRKDALREAIQIIEYSAVEQPRKGEIIAGLELCIRELPFSHWSKEAILDACDQWVQEHGELHLNAFTSAEMPSHTAIKNRFGITAKEFRDKYYPISDVTTRSKYYKHNREEWGEMFVEEFHRIQATGQDDYNQRRHSSMPTWVTIAKMFGFTTWRELLGHFCLTPYEKDRIGRRRPGKASNHPEIKVRLIEHSTLEQ